MILSLKGRIQWSFIIATLVTLVIGFVTFFHLDNLSREMEKSLGQANRLSLLTDELRISTLAILKLQRQVADKKATPADLERITSLSDSFKIQLEQIEPFYQDEEIKLLIAKMQGFVESLSTVATKIGLFSKDEAGRATMTDLSDKILESFSVFQDKQYGLNKAQEKKMDRIIGETKRNMLITLIVTFCGCIILSMVVPGKIALPFKKITDAIRELQDCNFDVSIYYNQSDEIGEIAHEINKMIASLKKFEELRTDRISLEQRKFDVLANMVKKNVLVANSQGVITYLNNNLYSLLQIQSDDVLNRKISESALPESIKEAYKTAIKRRSKIENAEIEISRRIEDQEGSTKEEVFKGYANIIPIRGKDSTHDYYVMLLSEEVFS